MIFKSLLYLMKFPQLAFNLRPPFYLIQVYFIILRH